MAFFQNIVLIVLISSICEHLVSGDHHHDHEVGSGVKVKRGAILHGVSSRRGYFGFPLGEDALPLPNIVQAEVTTPSPEDFKFVACFDSWNNNSGGSIQSEFLDSHDPVTCSKRCKDQGLQVSLLKGAECSCKSFTSFQLNKAAEHNCNVPCPVSDMDPWTPPISTESCGGNTVYSVYCSDVIGGHNCDDLPIGASDPPQPNAEVRSATFCGRCTSGSCKSGHGQGITPSYDYFPKNMPPFCRVFCGKEKYYAIARGVNQEGDPILEEKVRPPTKYAATLWDSSFFGKDQPPLPICACIDDISEFEIMDQAEADDKCSAPCPGNPDLKCGRIGPDPEADGAFYATIHCTVEGCADPPTTPTSTPEPTTDFSSTMTPSEETTSPPEEQNTTPLTSTTQEETTIIQDDEEDCTGDDYYPGGCSSTTEDGSSMTISPSTPPGATTPKTVATTPHHEDVNINCAVICSGTEYSGRVWTVCAGERGNQSCGTPTSRGEAVWGCSDHGEWVTEQPDYSGCESTWLEDADEDIRNITDTVSALTFLTKLDGNITNDSDPNYFGHEILTLTLILDRVVDIASHSSVDVTEFEPVAQKTVGITGTLITSPGPWHQLSSGNRSSVSTSLIQTVETTSLLLAEKVPEEQGINYGPGYEKELSSSPQYFVVAGSISKKTNADNRTLDFPSGEFHHSTDSLLKLPSGWQNLVTGSGESITYVGLLLSSEHANLLMPGRFPGLGINTNSREKVVINGNLMSFTIGGGITAKTGNLVRVNNNRHKSSIKFKGKGVEVTFHHDLQAWGDSRHDLRRKLHYGESPKAALGSGQCAFWDTDKLDWSTHGCKMLESSRHETICECNHLTSFAVLMDVHNYLGKDLGLEILTLLLCSISFLCLFVSVLVFSTFQGIQSERNSITKNLSICLLIGNTLVLLVLDRHYFNMTEGFCVASGIVTHYVFLVAFAWMGVEGIHLYRMVVHVFDSENNPLNMYRVMAYGVPLILVILTAMIGYLKGDRPYGGDVVCWLDGSYIWSFLVPVLLIVVENMIILFIALKTAYQVQYSSQKKVPAFQNKMRSFRIWLRGCLSLTILLGVTWLLGFFTLVPATPGLVAAYFFTILNASQGIFIFIFHCLYNDKVRHLTYQRFGNYLPSWISSSLHSSSSLSYPSDGGKGGNSGMKHSASDSSICKRAPKNISINPRTTTENKAKLSPGGGFPPQGLTGPSSIRTPYGIECDFGSGLPGGISIIGSGPDSVPQVVNRRGSIIRQQWDSFGTVSSVDSVRTIGNDDRGGRNGGSGSLSDSSYIGGNSTDNSERGLIR